ncbi:carboxypeptidase-like regulatory domain-containing protein [Rubrivirga sp.]|uniref:carboxypeptidase-like regulatory domain-containing protein n=1 Tax=Rubrivirga sp. TaxID=1885344 RepID=UPI003C76DA29
MLRFLALLVLFAASVAAQPATVLGTVTDAETGEPLAGANVVVAGTTLGTSADGDGRFVLEIGAGAPRLAATMLGYESASTTQRVAPGDVLDVDFRLRPKALELGTVEVVARDDGWHRALRSFTTVFLGTTPNAERTEFVNPEVIDLEAGPALLEAATVAPLRVRNDALGYDVTVHGLVFVGNREGRAWDGIVAFEDTCALCEPDVLEARERAYRGSLRHFLHAAVAGRAGAEGFVSRSVSQPGAKPSLRWYIRRLLGTDVDTLGYRLEAAPHGWDLVIDRAISVAYHGEPDERSIRKDYQESWLTPRENRIPLGPDGTLLDGADVVRHGYWDWERFADLLPTDYRPRE